MKILAIESSCDETAAAVIECHSEPLGEESKRSFTPFRMTDCHPVILSNIVSSQVDLHKKFGGVFPEIASRAHTENIMPVIEEALHRAKTVILSDSEESMIDPSAAPQDDNIDVIAVTSGPGLIGSLLVGVNTAKTLAFANNKPIIPINHWLGHIYSCWQTDYGLPTTANSVDGRRLTVDLPKFPILALIVSGGHTGLVLMKSHTEYETIGQTLDDAAGEAFDKVAKILGLGYPGGPAISKAAEKYQNCHPEPSGEGSKILHSVQNDKINISFPRSMLDRDGFDFSFSGLKTSVLYKVKDLTENWKLKIGNFAPVVAYEFQQCVIDILIGKTLKAAEKYQPKSILLCGGVSANKELRSQMAEAVLSFQTGRQQDLESSSRSPMSDAIRLEDDEVTFFLPPLPLTGDNAAMIGLAAEYQLANGIPTTDYSHINADSNMRL